MADRPGPQALPELACSSANQRRAPASVASPGKVAVSSSSRAAADDRRGGRREPSARPPRTGAAVPKVARRYGVARW